MAFPVSGTPVQTQFASTVTSMAVNMPATVNAGDLLIALVEVRNTGTWNTVPTDWQTLFTQAGGSNVGRTTGFYKIAAGNEDGATATWVHSQETTAVWQVIRVTDWDGTTPPESASTSGDYSTNPKNCWSLVEIEREGHEHKD